MSSSNSNSNLSGSGINVGVVLRYIGKPPALSECNLGKIYPEDHLFEVAGGYFIVHNGVAIYTLDLRPTQVSRGPNTGELMGMIKHKTLGYFNYDISLFEVDEEATAFNKKFGLDRGEYQPLGKPLKVEECVDFLNKTLKSQKL